MRQLNQGPPLKSKCSGHRGFDKIPPKRIPREAFSSWLQPKNTVDHSVFDSIGTNITLKLILPQVAQAFSEEAPKQGRPFFARKKMEPNKLSVYSIQYIK